MGRRGSQGTTSEPRAKATPEPELFSVLKGAAPSAEAVPDRHGKTIRSPRREAKVGPCGCRLAQPRDEPGGRGWISPCPGSLYPASGRPGPRGERTWKRSVLRPDNDFRKQRPSHGEQAVGDGGGERQAEGAPRPLSALGPCRGQQQSPHFQAHSPLNSQHRLQNQRR